MVRIFTTHNIRRQEELTGSLWKFTSCQGEKRGNRYQVATPCCWEHHPELWMNFANQSFVMMW